MGGFLYFVPGARTPDQAEKVLREAGALHVVGRPGEKPALSKVDSMGPGGTGMLVWPGAGVRTYDPGSQEWQAAPRGL